MRQDMRGQCMLQSSPYQTFGAFGAISIPVYIFAQTKLEFIRIRNVVFTSI